MSNTAQSLQKLLQDKWAKKELAHFYVLSANEMISDKNKILDHFLMSFFSHVLGYKEIKRDAIRSHPDFFFLGDIEEEGNYKVDELSEMLRFNELSPQSLKHKFMVIYHAHLVTRDLYNKLLKLLEEPNRRTTVFLLNDRGIELIPTIRSRALQLKLPFEVSSNAAKQETSTSPALQDFLEKKVSLNQLLEKLKTSDNDLSDELAGAVMQAALAAPKMDYKKLEELILLLQNNSTSQAFRNSMSERLFQLLAFAQKSL